MLAQQIAILLFLSNVAYLKADERIVNGVQALVNEFPYFIPLSPGPYMCGAAILTKNWIVTAAHCTHGIAIQDIKYTLGSSSERTISQLIMHPNYSDITTDNDIALIKSSLEIQFLKSIVQPIPITNAIPTVGSSVTVMGYGVTETGDTSSVLLKTSLKIADFLACNEAYGNALTQNMICASGENAYGKVTDSCTGDSGGPLVMNGVLVGIVSFGVDCDNAAQLATNPGVYTNVQRYVPWITTNAGTEVKIASPFTTK